MVTEIIQRMPAERPSDDLFTELLQCMPADVLATVPAEQIAEARAKLPPKLLAERPSDEVFTEMIHRLPADLLATVPAERIADLRADLRAKFRAKFRAALRIVLPTEPPTELPADHLLAPLRAELRANKLTAKMLADVPVEMVVEMLAVILVEMPSVVRIVQPGVLLAELEADLRAEPMVTVLVEGNADLWWWAKAEAAQSSDEAEALRLRAAWVASKAPQVWSRFGFFLPRERREKIFGNFIANHTSDLFEAIDGAGSRREQNWRMLGFTIAVIAMVVGCTGFAVQRWLCNELDPVAGRLLKLTAVLMAILAFLTAILTFLTALLEFMNTL